MARRSPDVLYEPLVDRSSGEHQDRIWVTKGQHRVGRLGQQSVEGGGGGVTDDHRNVGSQQVVQTCYIAR